MSKTMTSKKSAKKSPGESTLRPRKSDRESASGSKTSTETLTVSVIVRGIQAGDTHMDFSIQKNIEIPSSKNGMDVAINEIMFLFLLGIKTSGEMSKISSGE